MSTAPAPPSEYRTRVWIGSLMALLTAGVLVADHHVALWLARPVYPFLIVFVALLVALSVAELYALLAAHPRPPLWLVLSSCLAVSLAALPALLGGREASAWRDMAAVFALAVLAGFLWEMAAFREPGGVVPRLALLTWMTAYLGLLPSFFVQIRFRPAESAPLAGVASLALVIFVPKCCDIGAYVTGRAFGRTRMTPLLSPKKTWEGLAGGLALSVAVAVLLNRAVTEVLRSDAEAALFGLVLGLTGVLGDLAESMIKRDCQKKDASQAVPGFGGVLDVVDSVLFAAPVAYLWLAT
ncbi:MAG: phosphatidate cytidylyltransferase [Gemmataceae bacterium]